MKELYNANIYVALIHYPVVNKSGDVIASAVTNLDLHDIARASMTFGVRGFYAVTPLEDQKELIRKIVSHWTNGFGANYNPKRRDALELIILKDSIEEVISHIKSKESGLPKTVATCANNHHKRISYQNFREILNDGCPYLLMFGTAWGLTSDFIDKADFILAPIKGNTDYNHLSVRSAASIILDRLIGKEE